MPSRSISPRTATALAALGLAVGVGSVAAVVSPLQHDASAATGPQTLVYTARFVPAESGGIDTAPKGVSPGDTFVNVAALRRNGAPAGRLHLIGTVIDARFQGIQQTMTVFVKGGTLEVEGGGVRKPIIGARPASPADVFAVVGGTGTYVGASGELELTPLTESASRVTIRLR